MAQAFISYARGDEEAAKHLASELERRGVRAIWMDRLVSPGDSWLPQLQTSIANSDLFLVVVSPESERSQWIASETAFALAQAKQGRTRIVPVLVSRKAEPPPLIQHIQGIELFDPARSQRQLDGLVRSVKTGPIHGTDRYAEDLESRFRYLQASREAFEKEIAVQASRRAVWSSTITAAITALAAVATLLAGLISFSDVMDVNDVAIRWALPFGLGILSSVLVFVLSAWLRRRLSARGRHTENG